ncbi:hypothetical protein KP509_21G065700 [Ceratopteris richardii]|uniref:Uncharacterized protein n=1 Tax=Ceratopteris richardii TaxID=49495 RepID=A0A8T2SE50_CERRI|nr:hypothetical protein KP509_21G065700 [Ceratopteris richardii]
MFYFALCLEEVKALQWLQWQPHNEQLWPHIYFSPRLQCRSHGQDAIGFEHVAGVGSAVFIKGQKSLTSGDLKRLKR